MFIFGLLSIISSALGNVIELDSSFNEIVTDGPWLVKFYAPWCGYCRKLEPIYNELAVSLQNEPVKVARLDATKYPNIASLYQIRGYPTIKYINGTDIYTHDGDRTVQHLVQFTRRVMGAAVKHLPSEGRFREIVQTHLHNTFFLFIGLPNSYLKEVFNDIAQSLRLVSYFYSVESHSIPQDFREKFSNELRYIDNSPNGTIVRWRDDKKLCLNYDGIDLESLNSTMRQWILLNRFDSFPKITQHDIWDFSILEKSVIVFLFNSSDEHDIIAYNYHQFDHRSPSVRLFRVGKAFAWSEERKKEFEFVWSTDVSAMSDLVMSSLVVPNIFAFQPWNQTIYLHPEYLNYKFMKNLNEEMIIEFLNLLKSGKIQGYGGTGFIAKMRRAGYDFLTGLIEFISTTPLLAMFIIGIPLSVISFLCYAICCIDSNDSEYRKVTRNRRKERRTLYEAPLKSSEELNIKSDIDKKTD